MFMDRRNEDNCKLVISNLGSSSTNERVLSDIFSGFGNIIDILLKNDHCVIQYDRSESVDRAIRAKNGSLISGRRIVLRSGVYSNDYRRRSPSVKSRDRRGTSPRASHDRTRRSISRSPPFRRERSSDRIGWDRDRPPLPPPQQSLQQHHHQQQQPSLSHLPMSFNESRDAFSRQGGDYRKVRDETMFERNREDPGRTTLPSIAQLRQLDSAQLNLIANRPYDVAVVTMDHSLLNFADDIEERLQRQPDSTLSVHIIVLREESHVTPCLQDLTRKGVLMACIIGQQNRQHDSCSLRILHGTPQEHRNMPLVDAMKLMHQHYNNLVRCLSSSSAASPGDCAMRSQHRARNNSLSQPSGFIAPTERQFYLLNLLADGRMLTVEELVETATFINERISALSSSGGDGSGAGGDGITAANNVIYGGPGAVTEGDYGHGDGDASSNHRLPGVEQRNSSILGMIRPNTLQHASASSFAPDSMVHQQMRERYDDYRNRGLGPVSSVPLSSSSNMMQDPGDYAGSTNIGSTNSLNLSNPKVKQALSNLAPLFLNGSVPSNQAANTMQPPRSGGITAAATIATSITTSTTANNITTIINSSTTSSTAVNASSTTTSSSSGNGSNNSSNRYSEYRTQYHLTNCSGPRSTGSAARDENFRGTLDSKHMYNPTLEHTGYHQPARATRPIAAPSTRGAALFGVNPRPRAPVPRAFAAIPRGLRHNY